MNKREAYRKAAALVRKGWTQRAYARDERGEPVSPTDPDAVCFCMRGAYYHVLNGEAMSDAVTFTIDVGAALVALRGDHLASPVSFNDAPFREAEEVAEVLDYMAEHAV